MSRLRSRPLAITVGLLVLVAVALVVVLRSRDTRPDFRVGDESSSSEDGEGLMGGRRMARQRVADADDAVGGPALVARVGPGSTVLGFRTLVLDRDAKPVRIRQHTLVDLVPFPEGREGAPVRWEGYVAVQRPSGGRTIPEAVGPWRAAGKDGVLVRPGEEVRLRTRYDLLPAGSRCLALTLLDGPRWEVREDGGSWRTLRARDDEGDRTRDVDVRTGQYGALTFKAIRSCPNEESDGTTIGDDGMRGPDDLGYGS